MFTLTLTFFGKLTHCEAWAKSHDLMLISTALEGSTDETGTVFDKLYL
jgi:hypothetical protein